MICTHLRLLGSILISVLLFYLDILTDITVLCNYYGAHEDVFFGISCFALFSSLLAQILYSPLLSIYRNNNQQISTPSCIFRLLLSALYCTPLYLVYKFVCLQCCELAKGSNDELQLAKIDSNYNYKGHMHGLSKFGMEQQKEDPNMMVFNFDNSVLTQKRKYNLLNNMLDDMVRYSFIKSCFQSSINIFVQIFVMSQNMNNMTNMSMNMNINMNVLFVSTIISFICFCNAAWSQIRDLVSSAPQSQLNYCIPLLFRVRAIFESFVRILRFATTTVTFGPMFGGIVIVICEIVWKYIIIMVYSKKYKSKCDMYTIHKSVASSMLFSKERFKLSPYLMRFTDIVLWTILLLIGTIISLQVIDIKLKLDNICNKLFEFALENDCNCLPLELIIAITILIIFLLIIYMFSPSIFNLISSLDENLIAPSSISGIAMSLDMDRDVSDITVIDISKPVENPTMPKKGKRKYKNNNNLMLMSVDDEVDD